MSGRRVRRVIKLGGSLLRDPAILACFEEWYAGLAEGNDQVGAIDLLVVGGGQTVERLRKLDAQIGLGEYAAHWIAIGFMSANLAKVAARLNRRLIHTLEDAQSGLQILDPALLLSSGRIPLETSWRVTSDSIAATLARTFKASELILLKSAAPTTNDIEELARLAYVDACFPTASRGLKEISFINLSSPASR